jgi:hypothetical protein
MICTASRSSIPSRNSTVFWITAVSSVRSNGSSEVRNFQPSMP